MTLNKVQLIGNLTRDPETRTTPQGQTVTSFGVATSRQWTDPTGAKKEKTEFHNIVAWAKLAEICQQFLGKGRKVYIEGRLQTREWTADDGAKRSRTEIVAESMIMLDRAPAGASTGPGNMPRKPEPEQQSAVPPTGSSGEESAEVNVENIPF